jgi:hypothetical protein
MANARVVNHKHAGLHTTSHRAAMTHLVRFHRRRRSEANFSSYRYKHRKPGREYPAGRAYVAAVEVKAARRLCLSEAVAVVSMIAFASWYTP